MADEEYEEAFGKERVAAEAAVDLFKVRNSLSGFLSQVTRRRNALDKAVAQHQARPSSASLVNMTELAADLRVALRKFEDATERTCEADGEKREAHETACVDVYELCQALLAKVSDVALVPLRAQGGSAQGAAQQPADRQPALPRIATSLKPSLLTGDHSPTELRTWVKAFEAYYTASGMRLHPQDAQVAYLWNCVEPVLAARIQEDVREDAPVRGEASCMEAIKRYFVIKYPLILRRMDYYRAVQFTGERFVDYLARLSILEQEADITTLTVPQQRVFRALVGTSDAELQEHLLRLEEPTWEQLATVGSNHEGARQVQDRLKPGTAVSARAVSEYKRAGKESGRGRSPERKQAPVKKTWPVDAANKSMEGRCACCGARGHKRPSCPKLATARCGKCGSDRHMAFTCDQGQVFNAWKSPSRAQRDRAESASPGRSSSPRTHNVMTVRAMQAHGFGLPTPGLPVRCLHTKSGREFRHTATPDTGATSTVVSLDIIKDHNVPYVRGGPVLYDASGNEMPCEGTATLRMSTGDCPAGTLVKAVVSSAVAGEILISWHDLIHLGAVPSSFPFLPGAGGPASAVAARAAREKTVRFAAEGPSLPRRPTRKPPSVPGPALPPRRPAGTPGPALPLRNKLPRETSVAAARGPADVRNEASVAVAPEAAVEEKKVCLEAAATAKGPEAVVVERLRQDFSDVFADALGNKKLGGKPMKIFLKESDQPPFKQLTARPVGVHLKVEADRAVKKAVDAGVIVPVKIPTEFISPGFFVPKAGTEELRLVADYTRLNERVQRPVHPFPCTKDILRSIPPEDKWFAKLDLVAGYHQVPLDPESSLLTTFILPSGRYCYTRAPMGLSASSDEFCFRTDAAYAGLEFARKLVDDILVSAPTLEELEKRVRKVLQRSREKGITISSRKLKLGQSIDFAGHVVSAEGIRPHPEKLAALAKFPTPKDLTGVRSFLGLANQVSPFLPDLNAATPQLRKLLRASTPFTWSVEHQREFEAARRLLSSSPLLVQPFDMTLETEILTDASRLFGLGYILVQRGGEKLRVIQCGSKALTGAQSRYSTVELEMLGVQWAVHKCRHYLKGCPAFKIVTDHRPLLGLFKKSMIDIDNPRLQLLREKMAGYSFRVEWVQGKSHRIADALSRYPVFAATPDPTTEVGAQGQEERVRVVSALDPMLLPMRRASQDSSYASLVEAVRRGADPRKLPVNHPARQYAAMMSRLSVDESPDGALVVLDGHRLVVPVAERGRVLDILHVPHSGMTKTKEAARQLYYWPSMSSDVAARVEACGRCQVLRPSLPREVETEPSETEAAYPMEAVAADLFEEAGRHYLAVVDRFSGWPALFEMTSLATSAVVKHLEGWFLEFGYPCSIRTDGGPQFRAEFDEYCSKKGVLHELSSPYNPSSNGLAEAAVKSLKRLVQKCKRQEVRAAIAEWRNSPRADGISPAQMFLGRRMRGQLPSLQQPQVDATVAQEARRRGRAKTKAFNDRHSRILPALVEGQAVYLQNPTTKRWDQHATVVAARKNGRSYVVRKENGTEVIRNGRYVRARKE